jgi:hypothetical protein
MINWLNQWLGRQGAGQVASKQEASVRSQHLSLAERMAIRHAAVLTSVRDGMLQQGVLSSDYRVRAQAADERGHSYHVMMDLLPTAEAMKAFTPIDFRTVELKIGQMVRKRYRIKVASMYWRVADMSRASDVARDATGVDADVVQSSVQSFLERRRASGSDPLNAFDAGADALMAADLNALAQAMSRQSVRDVDLGVGSYQSSFLPTDEVDAHQG